MKLPRNLKEKALYLAIFSLIFVNSIGPIISMMEIEFSIKHYFYVLIISFILSIVGDGLEQ
ncbi:hypothetical protein [Lactobacillus johnsonii]|uniref:hypothetical protein n=1 Tax=Lactobacillus johnsonii TaxID=33959 RepID=UPI0028E526F9|nr:hypothetical protein [Lactobacillus johnsonii]MDT9605176.1 hypothetical protein [Lactobacillus johnsonii]